MCNAIAVPAGRKLTGDASAVDTSFSERTLRTEDALEADMVGSGKPAATSSLAQERGRMKSAQHPQILAGGARPRRVSACESMTVVGFDEKLPVFKF